MRSLFTTVLVLLILTGSAQSSIISPYYGISSSPAWVNLTGHWEAQPEDTTAWKVVDTMGAHFMLDFIDSVIYIEPMTWEWTYDKWSALKTNITTFAVGGYRPLDKYEQYRVCRVTGIRQVRYRIINYKFIPPPQTEYEQIIDSLSQWRPAIWVYKGYRVYDVWHGDTLYKQRIEPDSLLRPSFYHGDFKWRPMQGGTYGQYIYRIQSDTVMSAGRNKAYPREWYPREWYTPKPKKRK